MGRIPSIHCPRVAQVATAKSRLRSGMNRKGATVLDETISVLVVDDHTLTAEMTSAWLHHEGKFRTAHAYCVDSALTVIRESGTYDVLLLDVDMPGMNGLDGVGKMVAANAPGSVVIFSGQVRGEGAMRAIEMGARGFIPKTLPLKSLVNAVRFVALGEIFLPHSLAAEQIQPARRVSRSDPLSPVETDVVKGITRGMTNKAIANELGLSEIMVKAHVRSICAKLNASNRTQVALTAVMQGIG